MNKMERPMMTVVRFGAEDVIATSSRALGPFVALGSEINEYAANNVGGLDAGGYDINASDLYHIYIYDNDNVNVEAEGDVGYSYAWYNKPDGYWYTEYILADTYGYGNLPK